MSGGLPFVVGLMSAAWAGCAAGPAPTGSDAAESSPRAPVSAPAEGIAPSSFVSPTPPAEAGAWPIMGPAARARCHPASSAPVNLTVEQAIGAAKPGRYACEGYVVRTEGCRRAGGQGVLGCRPFIILSDLRSAGLKEPLSPTQDLVVFVDDPEAMPIFSHVRAELDVCSVPDGLVAAWAMRIETLP